MSRREKRYESAEIVVTYRPGRCIHAAECVRGLPRVFDPDRRPWISPERAGGDEIAAVVARCPTGALRYERLDGGEPEAVPAANTIEVTPGGPLMLRGDCRLQQADGRVAREWRTALCRCGASRTKPHCDNSHLEAPFDDSGKLGRTSSPDDASGWKAGGPLEVRPAPDGPLLLAGAFELASGDARERHRGVRGALCRCGASRNKPYCDGSHRAAGFRAD